MAARTCRDVVDRLIDYLADSLDPFERAELEAHLKACDGCVLYAQSYRQAVHLARSAFDHVGDMGQPGGVGSLVESILAARRRT